MSKPITTLAEYEAKMNEFERRVSYMCKAQRGYHVLIVSGSAGIGKTYRAGEVLKTKSEIPYSIVRGSISPVQMYTQLWQKNNACFVLDDVNSILKDGKEGASLLKAATDTYQERTLNWYKSNNKCIPVSKALNGNFTNNDVKDRMNDYVAALCSNKKDGGQAILAKLESGELFPNEFIFTGSLIILTNKRLSDFDRVTEGAVSNRGAHMEISLTRAVSIELINKIANSMTAFECVPLEDTAKTNVLKYINSAEVARYLNLNNKTLSLRTFGKLVIDVQNGEELTDALLDSITETSYV